MSADTVLEAPVYPFELQWDAALERYKGTIRTFARNFIGQIPYNSVEDLEQELRVVLWRCIKNYDPNRGASFNTLFQGSAKNHLISMVRTANTKGRTGIVCSLDVEAIAAAVDDFISTEAAEEGALRRMMLEEVIAEHGVEAVQEALSSGRRIKRRVA